MLYPERKGFVSLGYMENFVGNLCNYLVDTFKIYLLPVCYAAIYGILISSYAS